MIIRIDDQYRLASDRYSWTIQRCAKRRHRKTHTVVTDWQSIMWFANPQQAVQGLAELRLRTSNVQTVADALVEVKRVVATLCNALQPYFDVRIRAGPKESPDLEKTKPGEENTNDIKRTTV